MMIRMSRCRLARSVGEKGNVRSSFVEAQSARRTVRRVAGLFGTDRDAKFALRAGRKNAARPEALRHLENVSFLECRTPREPVSVPSCVDSLRQRVHAREDFDASANECRAMWDHLEPSACINPRRKGIETASASDGCRSAEGREQSSKVGTVYLAARKEVATDVQANADGRSTGQLERESIGPRWPVFDVVILGPRTLDDWRCHMSAEGVAIIPVGAG
jgi:hypothetical protein